MTEDYFQRRKSIVSGFVGKIRSSEIHRDKERNLNENRSATVKHENIGSECGGEEEHVFFAEYSPFNIYLSHEFQVKHVFVCHPFGLTFAPFNRFQTQKKNSLISLILRYLLSQSIKSYYRIL